MRVKRRVDIVRFLSAAPITKRANDKSEGQKRGEDKVREKTHWKRTRVRIWSV